MKHMSVLAKLYFVLIQADTQTSEREVAIGRQMVRLEGFSETGFNREVAALAGRTPEAIYKEIVEGLKRLDKALQIRCIAWMCIIANADGFMDKKEWQLIYKLYHKDLGLPLDQIMKAQNELMKSLYTPLSK
ncbi:MAG: TerB family tellurite resistance protein [Cyclobacteriaceae bacterium]|jgi:uncharacterized tellurite resistance protein B-like protein|nr:TerB family tellurite resistance protein [Cyclobacteriaceae bacterium]